MIVLDGLLWTTVSNVRSTPVRYIIAFFIEHNTLSSFVRSDHLGKMKKKSKQAPLRTAITLPNRLELLNNCTNYQVLLHNGCLAVQVCASPPKKRPIGERNVTLCNIHTEHA